MTFFARSATIVFLDSDVLMQEAVSDALRSAGYVVATAGSLGAAVDRLSEVKPDMLIIAPYIDSMSGHVAAKYLRRRHPGLPVLILAGLINDERITTRDVVSHFHSYPKPFSKDELLAAVRDVLKHEWEQRFVFYSPIGPVDGEFLD